MSAVRQYNYMRTAVVDGRPVLVKRCGGPCGLEKECSEEPSSDFSVAARHRGRPIWHSKCKACRRKLWKLKVEGDPEWARRRRERSTRNNRLWRNDPENRERVAEAQARYWAKLPEERKREYQRRQRERARPLRKPGPVEYVPNGQLRESVERALELKLVSAKGLGLVVFPGDMRPELRLRRALGIAPTWGRDGREYRQARVSVEVAVRVVKALDLDPVDFGV